MSHSASHSRPWPRWLRHRVVKHRRSSPSPRRSPSSPSSIRRTRSRHSTRKRRSTPSSQARRGRRKSFGWGWPARFACREGPLEVFLCKKGTKEHEAIVRIDADAKFIHLALKTAGGEPGTPTQFIDPKTEEPKWKAATGSRVKVLVHYTKGGKTFTHPAQEWIWDTKRKAPMNHDWVFAGSIVIKDPENGREYYGANSGDIISISNFPYSLLEIPSEVSKDDAQLTYEVKTDKVPPLLSKVWVILAPEKKG